MIRNDDAVTGSSTVNRRSQGCIVVVGAGWCWMIWCGVSILVRLHLFGRQSEGDRDFVAGDIVPCVVH